MSQQQAPERGHFGTALGFVLASAGSAIGLGNIWRFPYMAGESGGGAFVLIYLVFVLAIGVPVLFAELAVGRAAQRNPVGAYRILSGSRIWPWAGGLGVLTGFSILAFYSVVAGWTLGYLFRALTGAFHEPIDAAGSEALFLGLIGDPLQAIGLSALFLLLTVLVVRGGVQRGIERAARVLMPLFLLLLVLLAVRSLTLPGASEGLAFLFVFDFSEVTGGVVIAALGQALFSLSLGMGAILTYGSYLSKRENLPVAGATVALFDTGIALLAGLVIFPALFSAGLEPGAGAGLVFVVMPTLFEAMPAGTLFGIAFYALLAIAALTSTMSLLEVVVAWLVDERGWGRETAVWTLGAACFVLAVPSALSQGAVGFLSEGLPGGSWLDLQNILFGNYALAFGALLICLFVGWRWGTASALSEIEGVGHRLPAAALWGFLVRYVCPVAVVGVMAYLLITGQYD